MPQIEITKVSELLNAIHPNNIEVGHKRRGEFVDFPRIGEPFYVGMGYRTSPVTEIISFDTFKTKNSVYRIFPIPDSTTEYPNFR